MEMVTGEAMTPSPIYLTNMQPLEIIDKNDAQSPEQFMAFPKGRCIYCCDSEGAFNTEEHFFPESLGGGEWSVLPSGLMCDSCQLYFGTKVEKPVLSDWPFNFVRFSMAIPTKKKKSAQMETDLGHMTAYNLPGYAMVDAKCESPLKAGGRFRETTPAFPQEPRLVCRALVKIAIGLLADSRSVDVFAAQFNAARQFARFGDPKIRWWYFEHVNLARKRNILLCGAEAYRETIVLKIIYLDNIPAYFHLKYFFLDVITPIEPHFGISLPRKLPEGAHTRLRSTLHPPPGFGDFASMILRPEYSFADMIAICTWRGQ